MYQNLRQIGAGIGSATTCHFVRTAAVRVSVNPRGTAWQSKREEMTNPLLASWVTTAGTGW